MKSRFQFPDRRRQRGQTILWFLATVAACCCVFALVYNVGQVTNQKEQTVNAADAAALSGAVVEARMLNFEAYTNRAMIANEVTIAQLVSLDSWIHYDDTLLFYLGFYSAPIPDFSSLVTTLGVAADIATFIVTPIIAGTVPAIEADNRLLWIARESANSTGAAAANDIAGKIANANSTTFGNRFDEQPQTAPFDVALMSLNSASWLTFTDPYSGGNRGNAKSVILDSRDPFSSNRREGALIRGLNVALEVFGLVQSAGVFYPGFAKTSTYTTLEGYSNWEAQDSLDTTVTTLRLCGIIPCGYDTNVLRADEPIGYGRADANSNGGTGEDLCNVGPTTTNCFIADHLSNHIAWSGTNGDGIPNIRDLAQGLSNSDPCSVNNGSDSPSLSFVTAVQKPADATLTTQRLDIDTVDESGPQGSTLMTDNFQNADNLTSISAACTFFLRPDVNARDVTEGALARADGVHEYASLYNPYWQARLTAASAPYTSILYLLIGHPGLEAVTP